MNFIVSGSNGSYRLGERLLSAGNALKKFREWREDGGLDVEVHDDHGTLLSEGFLTILSIGGGMIADLKGTLRHLDGGHSS